MCDTKDLMNENVCDKKLIGEEFQFKEFVYRVISIAPNELSLIGAIDKDNLKEGIIPEVVSFKGLKYCVTTIEENALIDCESLSSITIPCSVTSINENLFLCFLHIINVSEHNPVYSSIDGVLFNKEQTELICYPTSRTDKHYSIPSSVIHIADEAFSPCGDLSSIEIPNSVKSIGYASFQDTGLEIVKLPNSIKTIDNEAFNSCVNLLHIEFPSSIIEISNGCCSFCNKLHSVKLPNSIISIGSEAFSWCSSLQVIELPNSVKFIGERAFGYSKNLSSVKLSKELESIGSVAFIACKTCSGKSALLILTSATLTPICFASVLTALLISFMILVLFCDNSSCNVQRPNIFLTEEFTISANLLCTPYSVLTVL